MLSRWIDPTITSLQDALNFKGSISNYQFQGDGIGKIGTTGFVLGFVGGFHFALLLLSMVLMMWLEESITNKAVCNILGILMHWSMYITSLCIFHFMEFFATAVYQPTSLSYNSYIVNHSTSYTVAAIASWFEFWLETYLFGSYKRPVFFIVIGVILVLAGQIIRTLGMIQSPNNGKTYRYTQASYHWNLFSAATSCLFWILLVVGWNTDLAMQSSLYSCVCVCFLVIFLCQDSVRGAVVGGFLPSTVPRVCSENSHWNTIHSSISLNCLKATTAAASSQLLKNYCCCYCDNAAINGVSMVVLATYSGYCWIRNPPISAPRRESWQRKTTMTQWNQFIFHHIGGIALLKQRKTTSRSVRPPQYIGREAFSFSWQVGMLRHRRM